MLRRPAYSASPRAREALEVHIKELMDLEAIRKVGHNEKVEVTTRLIMAWNKVNLRMVGYSIAVNNFTIPDRYLIPRIHVTLTQFSQDKFITAIDFHIGSHQNVLTENSKKL
ncbi:hypothetical protein O181_003295 [Austropuccinia psidii MF-1]|uniref:Uncharacterized protein n=1 Tax=Austropuccinia psidii MF-1 TaxID=1389203 RepID=A0A9Q3BE64_9BASI|nr:hypothetical protein [Austropuccinia psidii MF-1]